jgi:hypothetical protein
MKLSPLALGLLSLSAAACGDKSAIINSPSFALALGAYTPIQIKDACGADGVLTFPCDTEDLTSLDSVASDQADVVEVVPVVPGSALSAALTITTPFALHALKAGTATVRATGTFSDGTVRTASTKIDVRAISRVSIPNLCSIGAPEAQYALYGTPLTFPVGLYSGDLQLAGIRLDAVAGDALVISYDDPTQTMYAAWQTPDGPGQLVITSPLDPSVHETITAYGPLDVTSVLAQGTGSPPLYVTGPSFMAVSISPQVDGHFTCGAYGNVAPIARTETPDVCTGPNGESEWMGGQATSSLFYQILQEGVCRLSVGVAGGTYITEHDESVFFVHMGAQDLSITFGDACPESGMVSCDSARDVLAQCVDGVWTIAGTCPADQACDYVAARSAQCPGATDCAVCRGLQ